MPSRRSNLVSDSAKQVILLFLPKVCSSSFWIFCVIFCLQVLFPRQDWTSSLPRAPTFFLKLPVFFQYLPNWQWKKTQTQCNRVSYSQVFNNLYQTKALFLKGRIESWSQSDIKENRCFFLINSLQSVNFVLHDRNLDTFEGIISFRYICILHNEHYQKLCGVKGTVISVIILWICIFVMDLPNWPILGLGGSHAYVDFGLHCSFAVTKNVLYNSIMYTGWAVLFPTTVILFCYLNIFIRTSSQFFMAEILQRFDKKLPKIEPISNCFRALKNAKLNFC